MSDAVMEKSFQDLLPYSSHGRDKWAESLAKEPPIRVCLRPPLPASRSR